MIIVEGGGVSGGANQLRAHFVMSLFSWYNYLLHHSK